jgi:branched-chain amino acid aminotransferase
MVRATLDRDRQGTGGQPGQRRHPGFGEWLTDTMVTSAWTVERGWAGVMLAPRAALPVDPAAAGLHYGQSIFEGLKAHRQPDGSMAVFRAVDHARRFQRSARRLAMPELPVELFLSAVDEQVAADRHRVPADPDLSLYLRPLMIATEACLALRPAREYLFLQVAFVTGGFFADRPDPVTVWVSRDYTRASPGGTGAVKFGGNYGPAYLAQQQAAAAGCQQVLWLDPVRRHWVEEMGGMNVFFVRGTGPGAEVVTPKLTGSLLPGVTRECLLTLAGALGYRPREEHVSLRQWRTECAQGRITEAFACGTAAVVAPIGRVRDRTQEWSVGDGRAGPVTLALRDALVDIQRGTASDPYGWRYRPGTR